MADVNHVILIGRLTSDAMLKYTAGGVAYCKFSIAVNKRRKSGDEWVEEVSFFDIVLWGKSGESLNQYLVKGKQVAVEGELHQNRWEQDGQSRSKVEINANNVQLLGGQVANGQSSQGRPEPKAPPSSRPPASSRPQPSKPATSKEGPYPDDVDPPDFPDDIPF